MTFPDSTRNSCRDFFSDLILGRIRQNRSLDRPEIQLPNQKKACGSRALPGPADEAYNTPAGLQGRDGEGEERM